LYLKSREYDGTWNFRKRAYEEKYIRKSFITAGSFGKPKLPAAFHEAFFRQIRFYERQKNL